MNTSCKKAPNFFNIIIVRLAGFMIVAIIWLLWCSSLYTNSFFASGALVTGHCARCGVKHSLPTTDEAKHAALDLRARMIESGRIDVDELLLEGGDLFSRKNQNLDMDPLLAIDRLFERRGKMFGVLVCEVPVTDSDQHSGSRSPCDGGVVILKAFAGKLGGQWNLPGWTPIIGRVPESLPEFRRLSAEVTEIFDKIDNVNANRVAAGVAVNANFDVGEDAEKVRQLTKERACLANLALEEVRRHQLVTNFRGETYPISAIFSKGPTKLPGGVGDCAAPKLLAEAARLGLRPTGIAEFFVGATGGMSLSRENGKFYDSCESRCEQIAGFMLCGLPGV